MKYTDLEVQVPPDKREDINRKILHVIDTGDMQGITAEDVFNAYTGIGGLHGLKRSDFKNYNQYGKAKKEIEQGQFFTPHSICKDIAGFISPSKFDTIADITCGMGNFFNYFTETNCFGCEIDVKAFKVAEFLYPKANLVNTDVRFYMPDVPIDYILGNPPFNLEVKDPVTGATIKSQKYFIDKAHKMLKPSGLLIMVVPESFIEDTFYDKSLVQSVDSKFYFIGQYLLRPDTFKQMGVSTYNTKVMAFQKKGEGVTGNPISTTFCTYDELKNKIQAKEQVKNSANVRLKIGIGDQTSEFVYKVNKYLYEIKTHKELNGYYQKAMEHVNKYNTQGWVDEDTAEEEGKMTQKQLLSLLRASIKKQKHGKIIPDKVEYVKTNYGVKLKPYTAKASCTLKKDQVKFWSFNDYAIGAIGLPSDIKYKKLFERKKKEYEHQNRLFSDMEQDIEIASYLRRFTFRNTRGDLCNFNAIQKNDTNLLIQKRYGILAWQMGGGKTASSFAWTGYHQLRANFIVSHSLAIQGTWVDFLKQNRKRFIVINKLEDFDRIQYGDYILLSFHYIAKYKKQLKSLLKRLNYRVNFVFDESDEITNNSSAKTKNVLSVFTKCYRKLLTTGTTTRNDIGELYSQLELIYNNSINMCCWSPTYYVEEKGSLVPKVNKYYKKPFPAHYGQTVFRRCFNPSKSTVFGIQKQDQSIYNEDSLKDLIGKTVITRKFRELAGDKYKVNNILVQQDSAERAVYAKILTDLEEIIPLRFSLSGDTRRDAMQKILQQLTLLIEATSMPQMFDFYSGSGIPTKSMKIVEMVRGFADEKVAIGCTSKKGAKWYVEHLEKQFPDRPIFHIDGDVAIPKRKPLLAKFEETENGILVCTQQSLKSSINVPTCDKIIVESLQWNIPKIEQFYFRFIRYDSKNYKNVYFINYETTIEVNLLSLLMDKEKLNDYVRTLEYKENSEIYGEYDIDLGILNDLMTKAEDENGKTKVVWGKAKAMA